MPESAKIAFNMIGIEMSQNTEGFDVAYRSHNLETNVPRRSFCSWAVDWFLLVLGRGPSPAPCRWWYTVLARLHERDGDFAGTVGLSRADGCGGNRTLSVGGVLAGGAARADGRTKGCTDTRRVVANESNDSV